MLENVQIGLDLASAISIIGAASLFLWQFYRERKRNRKSEIWANFREIADDIAEKKLGITDLIAKQLYYKEDGSSFTIDEAVKILPQLMRLTTNLQFHIRYDAKQDFKNILAYHSREELEDHPIVKLIDRTLKNIQKYILWLHELKDKEFKDIEDHRDAIIDATVTETTLTTVIKEMANRDATYSYRQRVNNFKKTMEGPLREQLPTTIKHYELTDKELESCWILTEIILEDKSEEERKNAEELVFAFKSVVMKHKFSLQITLDSFNHTLLEGIKKL